MRKAGFTNEFDQITFFEMGKNADRSEFKSYLDGLKKGKSIGMLSEAGMPCIADPGSTIVAEAHEKGFNVEPLAGPNSKSLSFIS